MPSGQESISAATISSHRRLVGAHPLAVEGRQHQPAAGEVLGAFQQQQRARAEDRFEDDVAARRQPVRALRVEGLDRGRVGDQHHRPLEAEEADAEGVAVAARRHSCMKGSGRKAQRSVWTSGLLLRFGRQRHARKDRSATAGSVVPLPGWLASA